MHNGMWGQTYLYAGACGVTPQSAPPPPKYTNRFGGKTASFPVLRSSHSLLDSSRRSWRGSGPPRPRPCAAFFFSTDALRKSCGERRALRRESVCSGSPAPASAGGRAGVRAVAPVMPIPLHWTC